MKAKIQNRAARLYAIAGAIVREALKQIDEAQLLQAASSLAYTTILSVIPLMAMSFAIFKAFGGMDKVLSLVEPFVLSNLAEGVSDEVIEKIRGFIANAHASALGIGGLLGLLFTSMSMLWSIERAINRVWRAQVSRSWFHRISTYWLFITLGPVCLGAALGFIATQPAFLGKLVGGVGLFCMGVAFFFCLYQFVPNVRVQWKYSLISALVTSSIWNIAQVSYTVYTRRVLTYDKIYGSLGAVPILLLWIYIAWVIVLAGAAFTAALQRRAHERVPKAAT